MMKTYLWIVILTIFVWLIIPNYSSANNSCDNARINLSKLYKELDTHEVLVMDINFLEKKINEYKTNLDIANASSLCLTTYIYEEKYYSLLWKMYTKMYTIESYRTAISYYKEAMKYAEFMCNENWQDCTNDVIYMHYIDSINMLNKWIKQEELKNKSNDEICFEQFWLNTYWDDKHCYCNDWYVWNSSNTSCIKSKEDNQQNMKLDKLDSIKSTWNNYIDAANRIAILWIIADYSHNTSWYNLDNTITRREMLKIMMNLSSWNVWEECNWVFKDMNDSDWWCKYAESAVAFKFISQNELFRPNDNISKIEAVKMLFQAKWIKPYKMDDWRDWYINKWVELGLFNSFSDFDTKVLRAWIFDLTDKLVINGKD